jgi:soluble cytochrome b562
MIGVALQCGFVALCVLAIALDSPEKRPISRKDHEEEMKGIREQMKTLQTSNDEILALLKRDHTTGE